LRCWALGRLDGQMEALAGEMEARAELQAGYELALRTPSDINEHLATLRGYASQCVHVTECGVRSVVSSWALAAGLRAGARLVQVDLQRGAGVAAFGALARRAGLDVAFHEASDLVCPLEPTELLFLDTWHVYGQLRRELARWHGSVSKYIILHDTTVDEWSGESVRCGSDILAQSLASGFPLAEICCGLWPAIAEFLAAHGDEWALCARFTHNNGLTVLQRRVA